MELPPPATARLARTRFADVRHVARTGSTNVDVLELGRAGEAEGIVVVADAQHAGRGRRGRTWQAAPGDALLLSILLRPPAQVVGLVTAALALAAHDAALAAGIPPEVVGIKWPNDLVSTGLATPAATIGDGAPGMGGAGEGPGRKLAGILAEVEWSARSNVSAGWRAPGSGERATVAAGIGVNLHWPPVAGSPDTGTTAFEGGSSECGVVGSGVVGSGAGGIVAADEEVAARAVSLDELSGRTTSREEVLVDLLVAFEERYGALVTEGPAGLLAAWRARCITLGRHVRVDLGADDVEGTAVDLTDDGHLVVETLEGVRRTLAVGDVVHLR